MKSSHLILIVASLVILGAITYMFTAAESPEDYIEKIEDILQHGGWHKDGAPTAQMLQKNDVNNHWPFLYPPMLG